MELISTGRAEEFFDYKKEFSKYDSINIGSDVDESDNFQDLLYKLITSDVMDYHKQISYEIPDDVIASLIVNDRQISFGWKVEGLKKVLNKTEDIKLRQQISEYIDYLEYSYRSFYYNEGGEYIYAVYPEYGNDKESVSGYFKNIEDIYPYIKDWDESYRVEKICPIGSGENRYDCSSGEGVAVYDKNGKLDHLYAGDVPKPIYDNLNHFAYRYFIVPHPFEEGDLIVNTEYGDKGVVKFTDMDEDSYERDKEILDYSDALHSFYYEGIRDGDDLGYDFYYDHVNPLKIRYVRDEDWKSDEERNVYNMLQRVIKGETFLFCLECEMSAFRRWSDKEKLNRPKA